MIQFQKDKCFRIPKYQELFKNQHYTKKYVFQEFKERCNDFRNLQSTYGMASFGIISLENQYISLRFDL